MYQFRSRSSTAQPQHASVPGQFRYHKSARALCSAMFVLACLYTAASLDMAARMVHARAVALQHEDK